MQHALLGASSSRQWLHCTPSARLQEHIPNPSSSYAEEGSFAHEVCEYKMRKYLHQRVTRPQSEQYYSEELDHATDVYYETVVRFIRSMAEPLVLVEERVDYSHVVPEGFGTADLIILGGNVLHICDYKHGIGVPVDAEKNSQMMLYALGALHGYDFLYPIDTVRMTIIQPRRDYISTYEMSAADLIAWGESIRPIAQMAYEGTGDLHTGDWCRFCRAQPTCRAHLDEALTVCQREFAPPASIPIEELAEALPTLERVADWIKKVQTYLSDAAIHFGADVPGYKVVHGRSSRVFRDLKKVEETALEAGYTDIYTHDLISLTAFERLMGKEAFTRILGDLVEKPDGSPKLVPVSDPRPAITISQGEEKWEQE